MNELTEYIIRTRKQGFNDEQIKEALLTNGYTDEQVSSAFASMPRKSKLPLMIVAVLVLVICAAAAILVLRPIPKTASHCEGLTLSIHMLANKEVLCRYPDNSKVTMVLKNSGELPISKVDIRLEGTTMVFDSIGAMAPGEISIKEVQNPSLDPIDKIILTPYSESRSCPGLEFTQLRVC